MMEKKYHLQALLLSHSKIDCDLCSSSEEVLRKVHEVFNGHLTIYEIDCANDMKDMKTHCSPEHHSKLPDIVFFQPEFRPDKPYHPLDDIRFKPKELHYTDQLESTKIVRFAEKHFPWYFEVIEKKKRYEEWLLKWPLQVKLAYFDDFDEPHEAPAFYRMLSADFKMDIDFAYI